MTMATNPSRTDEASRKRVDPEVADLVNRARNGERKAWDALVDRYAPSIWSICRRYPLDAGDAENAAQSIWLKLMDHLGSLRDPAALPSWLATTTRRECGRILRATRRPCDAGYAPDAGPTPDDHARAAEQDLLAAERHAALREAFGQLPPGCQQLITLLIHDPALSCAEIGATLGIPVGSIGPSRRCCLDKLRRHPAIAAPINADTQTATSDADPQRNEERLSPLSRAFPASPAIPTWANRQTAANAPPEICEPSRARTQTRRARIRDASRRLWTAPLPAGELGEGMRGQTLLWIGCGGCSGETQYLLGVEGQASDLLDLIDSDGLRLLWHPSLAEHDLRPIHQALMDGREHLTVLCVEGSIALAEDGMFDMAGGAGKFRVVASLCGRADYVLAMGACAGYGGWPAQPPNPSGAVGLQYTLDTPGGLLPAGWRSRKGLPVIAVAGCPVPAQTLSGVKIWPGPVTCGDVWP